MFDKIRVINYENLSFHKNPGYSIFKVFLKKFANLVDFSIKTWRNMKTKKVALSKTKGYSKDPDKKFCIVLSNGPSINSLILDNLLKLQKINLDIFAINYFANSTLSNKIQPTYYLLSDPVMHPEFESEDNLKLWQNLQKYSRTTFVFPTSWYDSAENISWLKGRTLYFDDRSLETFTRNISPLKPRGYPSLTGYKAVAFALHLNYEQIGILGFDESKFKHLYVDEKNHLIEKHNYFYNSETDVVSNLSEIYRGGLSDYFYDVSRVFYGIEKAFSNRNILNLSINSYLDFFPKSVTFAEVNIVSKRPQI